MLLLEEVVNSFGGEGTNAIMDAVRERFNESRQEKVAGSLVWWRVSKEILLLGEGLMLQKDITEYL